MSRGNWAARTIRDGAVRIGGRTYRPSTQWMPYDGRLDGMRYLFGRYWSGDRCEPYVSLWGPATMNDPSDTGPEVVDGTLVWQFWFAEASHE